MEGTCEREGKWFQFGFHFWEGDESSWEDEVVEERWDLVSCRRLDAEDGFLEGAIVDVSMDLNIYTMC